MERFIMKKLLDWKNSSYRKPLILKGMPESVLMWTEARDVSAMQEALSDIIGAYERDFAKHPNISEFPKISIIWKSIPSQLAREKKVYV